MRKRLSLVRRAEVPVVACTAHLGMAMEAVVAPENGGTHLLVARTHGRPCGFSGAGPVHPGAYELTPEAVIA